MPLSHLLAFLEHRAPAVHAALRGAPPEDIAVLAAVCPRPLPASYLEFLRVMGSVGFDALPETDVRPASLWQHTLDHPRAYPEHRLFKFGLDLCIGHDICRDWFFDLDAEPAEDPPVVRFEDEGTLASFSADNLSFVAHTWTALLQARAFLQFAVDVHPAKQDTFLVGGDAATIRLARIAGVCERLGLTATMPSQPGLHTLERRDASLLLELPPHTATIRLRVGADSPATALHLVEVVRDHLEH